MFSQIKIQFHLHSMGMFACDNSSVVRAPDS